MVLFKQNAFACYAGDMYRISTTKFPCFTIDKNLCMSLDWRLHKQLLKFSRLKYPNYFPVDYIK
jgi:hypothetical protein